MSYHVNVTNNSGVELQTSDGKTVAPNGGTWESPLLGNATVGSDMFGTMLFIDLGDKHIGGDTKETWGVLIRYHDTAVVGRYEDAAGTYKVEFNEYLQARVHGPSLRQVSLTNILIGEEPAFSPDDAEAAPPA